MVSSTIILSLACIRKQLTTHVALNMIHITQCIRVLVKVEVVIDDIGQSQGSPMMGPTSPEMKDYELT